MSRRSGTFVTFFGIVIALAVIGPLSGLVSGGDSEGAPGFTASLATPAGTPTPAAAPDRVTVALELSDAGEIQRAAVALEAAGYAVGLPADATVSDRRIEGATSYVTQAWALVVHPRAPLLDLPDGADALLGEEARTWADLLGDDASEGEANVRVLLQREAQSWLDRTYPGAAGVARSGSAEEILAAVAADPLAVGLVGVEHLDPRVRALTVAGHDPYRDSPLDAPLADARWVRAADATEAARVAESLGWSRAVEEPVGVLATGELIPARCSQAVLSEHEDGFDAMFDGTRDVIGAADLALSHWEPAIAGDEPTPCTTTFNLSTSPEAAQAAARAGIDVALAVGNHLGDCWSECAYPDAILETLEHLGAAGLLVAGAGEDLEAAREPVVTTVEGVTFAILAYDEVSAEFYGATASIAGTSPLDLDALEEDVRAAKARADHVIVGFSWGVEYVTAPTDHQREASRVAIEAGASLVVGNHPHWVQAVEWLEGAFIVYALGNFVFDQDWSVETTQGAVLEVGFTRDRILGARLRPTAVRERHLVEWVPPASAEGRAILGRMWDAMDALPPREVDEGEPSE